MLPRDVLTIAMMTTGLVVVVTGVPTNLDPEDYEVLTDNEARSIDRGNATRLSLCFANEANATIQSRI